MYNLLFLRVSKVRFASHNIESLHEGSPGLWLHPWETRLTDLQNTDEDCCLGAAEIRIAILGLTHILLLELIIGETVEVFERFVEVCEVEEERIV